MGETPSHTPEMIAMARTKPWQIAADLEAAAMAVKEAWRLINAVAKPAHHEIDLIPHIAALEDIAPDLQGLSDKWQSIADAEPEPGSDEWLKRSPQFHPGDIA